jgi:tetratricopeptide (TPR) repeat protein
MRRLFLTSLVVAPLLAGCASLRARMIAQEGVDLYHKQDYAGAAAKFAEAEAHDPTIPTIELNLGFANLSLYRMAPNSTEAAKAASNAIAAFERYLKLKPKDERARIFLVQTFVDTGKYEDAVAFFKPAVEGDRPDPSALNTLAIIAAKTGRFQEAKSWYEKRIAAEPESTEAHLALGVLLWNYLHDHPEENAPKRLELSKEALDTLAAAIKLSPNAPNAYTYTNLVYREKALGESSDDDKRVDFEEANRFYKLGIDRMKGGK